MKMQRFLLDCVFTLVLSLLFFALSASFDWGWTYLVCLLIAIIAVFVGELALGGLDAFD